MCSRFGAHRESVSKSIDAPGSPIVAEAIKENQVPTQRFRAFLSPCIPCPFPVNPLAGSFQSPFSLDANTLTLNKKRNK